MMRQSKLENVLRKIRLACRKAALIFSASAFFQAQLADASGELSPVFIRAPDVSESTFAARAAARPGATSLIERLEHTLPSAADSKKLADALTRAQALYLSGSTEQAERGFRDVIRFAHDADWHDVERRAISFSYLRLAQLASDPEVVEKNIEAAAAFAPDLEPDSEIFAPPILASWKKAVLRLKTKSVAISVADKFPGYSIVKVDGRSQEARPGAIALIAPGLHRVSALSNAYPYFSQTLSGSQLEVMKIDQNSLAAGTCEAPSLPGRALIGAGQTDVAFSECVKSFGPAGWIDAPPAVARSTLDALPSPEFQAAAAPAWARTEGPGEPAGKTKWVWYAVAAAATAAGAGFLAYQLQNKGDPPQTTRVQPTVRDGL